MAAEANADTDAATSGARGATGNYSHGGDSEFARENADVNTEEAHAGSVLDQTRSWNAKVDRDFEYVSVEMQRAAQGAQDHLEGVRQVQLQMLTNMVGHADDLNKQHTAHRDIATDRTWTASNELEAALAAKSGVQADAMVTLLAKAISDALASAAK